MSHKELCNYDSSDCFVTDCTTESLLDSQTVDFKYRFPLNSILQIKYYGWSCDTELHVKQRREGAPALCIIQVDSLIISQKKYIHKQITDKSK